MKTPGEQITTALLEQPERRCFDITVDRKAVVPILSYPSTAETVPRVIPGSMLPMRMRNLIPGGTTTGSGILYVREISFNKGVIGPVSPGAPKAQADMTYEVKQQPVVTIPAYMKLPAQYWDDFPMFQSWMDARLLYGLAVAEEDQLLNGNGTLPNLEGFLAVALSAAGGASLLSGVGAALAKLYQQGYLPTGIVVNPADWGNALANDPALGAPALMQPPISLWGVPVVASPSMISGECLVGQFAPFSQIFDREDATVEIATQNQDDFIRNLVTVRAEERLTLAIYQPSAFVKGTYTP